MSQLQAFVLALALPALGILFGLLLEAVAGHRDHIHERR